MKHSIREIVVQLKEISIAEKQLTKLVQLQKGYLAEIDALELEIMKKSSKIESINKLSIVAIYHMLLGTKESKLEMLKKHYLQLSLTYNDLVRSLEHVEEDIRRLTDIVDGQKALRAELNHKIQIYDKEIGSSTLEAYRRVAMETTRKLRLIKEIDEAIDQGVIVNKKFNKAIKFIKKKAQEIFDEVNDKRIVKDYTISNISKYQGLISSLKHSLVKFEIEINDVYKEILNDKNYTDSIVTNFVDEYRINLVSDLTSYKTMDGSYTFLKNFKSIMMSTTRSLRSDLRKLKKELYALEERERSLIVELEKS